ncbi:glycoprotein-N-acetylgalactosamine 3-beta-galactosyltransferase [Cladorrhinum sp. PSN259]|nr:glycoprotein-N-acetylgalactosamine 3-beta-galactosyltransferase [Cladorrhinum sp. PSN259]
MIVSYKNNRLVPAVIVATCICFVYYLVDPSVDNYGASLPDWRIQNVPATTTSSSSSARARPTTQIWSEPSVAVETATPSSKHESGDEHGSPNHSSDPNHLSPEDVLLVMKTGSTSMWKRLLVHLSTSLAPERIPLKNTVIYSDKPETIGTFNIIDVLANMTEATKARPDFDVYRQQPEYDAHNVYVEAAGVDGDNFGPPGGWIIDKYKFMPLMAHAGENWPKAKWYIYMEDDTYLFLPNVLAYLDKFDWRKPHYLGSFAAKSNITFAHGGAGFAISRGAWERSFGENPKLSDEYEEYTADHCCGDQVLGHALNRYGVEFGENGGDGKFTWGFNPIVHWRFAFSQWNWCSPLLSWHKVHNRDVARYYELENKWNEKHGRAGGSATAAAGMLHRDFFLEMIAPDLKKRAEWWDNLSELYQVSSGNRASPPVPETKHDLELWKKAWESTDACEAACEGWEKCVQWSYVEDLCKMDDKMMMGQGYAPAMSERKTALKRTSGWLTDRLDKWSCE